MQLADLRRVNRRSIHDAGPRYMPGQDPNAPNLQIASIVETIDALGMTEAFRARVDSLRSGVSETSNETPAQFRTNLGRLANSPTQLAASLQALTTASPSEAGTVAAMVRRIAVAVQRAGSSPNSPVKARRRWRPPSRVTQQLLPSSALRSSCEVAGGVSRAPPSSEFHANASTR